MRSLIQFLVRYNSFFLFLLLEAFCIFLIVRNRNYQKVSFLNSSNAVSGGIYNSYNNFTDYLHLKRVNDSLMVENAKLLSELPKVFKHNSVQRDTICDDDLQQEYIFISAKVINNTITSVNNFITINKGSKHGIRQDMGVILPNGVVGVVKDVSKNMSTVISVLNRLSRINVKLKKSNYKGTLMWNGGNPRFGKIAELPQHVSVSKGDTIVTRRGSSIFPDGIMVGIVTNVDIGAGENFYDITVRLSTDFETLEYVYVVDYLLQEEQLNLESNF